MSQSIFIKHRRTAFDGAQWDSAFREIHDPCNAGAKCEQSGDESGAIANYAKSIEIGERHGHQWLHAYSHAYERIIALLRRTPDIVTLEQYCRAYIANPVHESTQNRINQIIQSI